MTGLALAAHVPAHRRTQGKRRRSFFLLGRMRRRGRKRQGKGKGGPLLMVKRP